MSFFYFLSIFLAARRVDKSLPSSSGQGVLSRQAVRRKKNFAVRFGLRLVFYTVGSLDGIKTSL